MAIKGKPLSAADRLIFDLHLLCDPAREILTDCRLTAATEGSWAESRYLPARNEAWAREHSARTLLAIVGKTSVNCLERNDYADFGQNPSYPDNNTGHANGRQMDAQSRLVSARKGRSKLINHLHNRYPHSIADSSRGWPFRCIILFACRDHLGAALYRCQNSKAIFRSNRLQTASRAVLASRMRVSWLDMSPPVSRLKQHRAPAFKLRQEVQSLQT